MTGLGRAAHLSEVDYIALAIPAFFALMGLEWLVARWRGMSVYRFSDWVANLGCGIAQQTFKVALALFTFLAYRFLYENHRWLELDVANPWVWVLGFVGIDLAYYWFHRLSHEINFLWAAHVVHHQSEEYNLGVALRQSTLQGAFSWPFYLPLALIGLPPVVFGPMISVNLLYQFLIHTRLVGRLGPLEWVLNTPSHHRVHHGQNPQYIDRNHGGTLIVWDRLFGTFEPEGERVIYGVTEPPGSWNPVFANVHHWILSWRRMRLARNPMDKLRVWIRRPGFVPEGVPEFGKRQDPTEVYDPPVGPAVRVYAAVQLLGLAGATTAYLFVRAQVDPAPLVAWGASIIASAGSLGGLLDGARWARTTEVLRPFAVVAVFAGLMPDRLLAPGPGLALVSLAAASALWSAWAVRVDRGDSLSPGPVEPLHE